MQHWMSTRRLAFTEGRICSMKPRQGRGISCMSVYISSPRCFFCSSWWCGDNEDDEEETTIHSLTPIKDCCDTSTHFFVETCSFTIIYVDPDIAGKRVGEDNTQLFSWHWPGDDESILLIVASIVNTDTLSMVNAASAGLQHTRRIIRALWGFQEEANGDGGLYTRNVAAISDTNTAARLVKAAMKLNNPTLFSVVYCGQQANGTAGAQTPMHGGLSYPPPNNILPPPAEDMMDDVGEELDDDAMTHPPNPRSLPMTITGFQKLERIPQQRIIRGLRYLEVIQNGALGPFADYEQSVVADEDVSWLHDHDHIVNPPAAGSLANTKHTSSCPAASWLLWGWNALAGQLFKDLCCGWVLFWHCGGWTDGW